MPHPHADAVEYAVADVHDHPEPYRDAQLDAYYDAQLDAASDGYRHAFARGYSNAYARGYADGYEHDDPDLDGYAAGVRDGVADRLAGRDLDPHGHHVFYVDALTDAFDDPYPDGRSVTGRYPHEPSRDALGHPGRRVEFLHPADLSDVERRVAEALGAPGAGADARVCDVEPCVPAYLYPAPPEHG